MQTINFQSILIIAVLAFITPLIIIRIKKIKVPFVVGEIFVGIIVGKTFLNIAKVVTLCSAGDYDDMLTPGYYGVNVSAYSKNYNGFYYIQPKNISKYGLINLRQYLEKVMAGLSQNLYIQRMIGQRNVYGDGNYSIFKLYRYINNNIQNVISSIESIVKNPITDLIKDYKE